jgi:uncharacterized protein
MKQVDILDTLKAHREILHDRFSVKSIALFGSYARGDARPNSDIDLLVEFEGPATFLGYMGLIEYLEDLFGTRVDIATRGKLKPRVRPRVEAELIRVA